ncbi:uncharacterized protein N7483_010432 [Penicillium malachiteum]|uniref:uncharacterized protein n=1 Tax=Penicillium malachiteum TaxID=1324776 RepID=UPI0025478F90|nr:uncharacterized protein N7483_010432 [Penicillium malachiteum]KAJ5713251.1 hypothetical protein N7483_010432 [Penicillium malachiteum]
MASQEEKIQLQSPNKFHLAFALAIVKLKPPNKELKDYILEIRKFIRSNMQIASPGKFFDSVAFWQKAYKDSEAEQTKLLNKIFELEQRTQGLRSKIKEGQTVLHGDSQSMKRKTSPSESGKSSVATRKRAQLCDSKIQQQKLKDNESSDESDTSENENAPKLMRQIYTVQRALQKKQNYKTLTTDAVTLCKLAEFEIIGTIIRLNEHEPQPKTSHNHRAILKNVDLLSATKAVALAFNLAQQALRKIVGCKDEKNCKGQLIYYLVCLFESTMGSLTRYCETVSSYAEMTSPVSQGTSNSNKGSSQKHRRVHSKKVPLILKTRSPKIQNDVAPQLVDLLVTMFRSLDTKQNEDQEVMEGMLFITIDRVGKILALVTFNNHKPPSDICPGLSPPQGLTAMNEEGLTVQSVQFEAKHLIAFLNRVLDSSTLGASRVQLEFFQKMKQRFQKTLLQAVFGTGDPLFKDGLIRPTTPLL